MKSNRQITISTMIANAGIYAGSENSGGLRRPRRRHSSSVRHHEANSANTTVLTESEQASRLCREAHQASPYRPGRPLPYLDPLELARHGFQRFPPKQNVRNALIPAIS